MRSLSAEAEAATAVSSSTDPWPHWHTWPFLSRVCFTLGNLTTSNDANRSLIALSCESLKPLVLLLRECGQSLQKLGRKRRHRDIGKLLGDDVEASTEGNHCEEEEEARSDDGAISDSPVMSPQRLAIDEPVLEDEGGESMEGDIVRESVEDEYRPVSSDERLDVGESEGEDLAKEQELADVAIKMLRLVANVAIESKVGSHLASDTHALAVIVQLLGDHCNSSVSSSSSGPGVSSAEELMLNIVAACTNISYYACVKASSFSNIELDPDSSWKEKAGGSELNEFVIRRVE